MFHSLFALVHKVYTERGGNAYRLFHPLRDFGYRHILFKRTAGKVTRKAYFGPYLSTTTCITHECSVCIYESYEKTKNVWLHVYPLCRLNVKFLTENLSALHLFKRQFWKSTIRKLCTPDWRTAVVYYFPQQEILLSSSQNQENVLRWINIVFYLCRIMVLIANGVIKPEVQMLSFNIILTSELVS